MRAGGDKRSRRRLYPAMYDDTKIKTGRAGTAFLLGDAFFVFFWSASWQQQVTLVELSKCVSAAASFIFFALCALCE